MKKQLLAILMATMTLSGCGAAVTAPQPVAFGYAASLQSVAASLPTGLTITNVTGQTGPSPMPGHLLPTSESFTITGQSDQGRVTITVKAVNPQGEQYVPTLSTISVNGKPLALSEARALASLLHTAAPSTLSEGAQTLLMRLSSILALSH